MASGYQLSSMTNYTSGPGSTTMLIGMYKHNLVERKRSIIRPLSKGPRHYCLPSVRIRMRLGYLCWRRRMLRPMVITVR